MALPAATISEGILGTEAEWHWTAGDGGLAIINRQGVHPRFKLDGIVGLHDLPEADDNREPRSAMLGELPYPGHPRGKTLTLEGRVQGRTLPELRTWARDLRMAFAERSLHGTMVVRPPVARGGVHHAFTARVLALESPDTQTRDEHAVLPWQREFTLGLRMADPRFFADWPNKVNGAAGTGVSAVVNNPGPAHADPIFTATVAAGGTLTLENQSILIAGVAARLRFGPITSAGTVTINFETRKATHTVDGDIVPLLDDDFSSWWDDTVRGVKPGNNTLLVSGAAAGTNWSVEFHPRSW